MLSRIAGALIGVVFAATLADAAPIRVVAAENVYGDIAKQIGGEHVSVVSILRNPDQDPHSFEASASTARELAAAQVVIYNGIGYDPWAVKLLSASPSVARETIVVASLVRKTDGDNPHVWYDPAAAPALAKLLALAFSRLDPSQAKQFAAHLAMFERSLRPLADKIGILRKEYAGVPVTATEPVFGYIADALGLKMRNMRFQVKVMNGAEPGAADIAAFETDLRTRAVRVLFYNSQTSEPLTERMKAIALQSGVPVVGVTETEPLGETYQAWMLSQLDAVGRALGRH